MSNKTKKQLESIISDLTQKIQDGNQDAIISRRANLFAGRMNSLLFNGKADDYGSYMHPSFDQIEERIKELVEKERRIMSAVGIIEVFKRCVE